MGKVSFLSGNGNETTIEGLSRAVTRLFRTNGVYLPDDLQVTENGSPDDNILIAPGSAFIGFDAYTEPTQDRFYHLFIESAETLQISANASGNPRIDAIVAYVDTANPASDDNDGAGVIYAVEGTPAGSPTAPTDSDIQTALGAGVRWIRLANVTVANGFSSITDANMTDTRTQVALDAIVTGWTPAIDTLTYASATTITISGVDRTDIYTPGTKLKYYQSTGEWKFAYVVGSTYSTDTTITISESDDYTLENEAILTPYYSYIDNPQGFPHWFNYTPTWTNLTVGNATVNLGRFKINGREVTVRQYIDFGSTTAISASKPRYSLPVTAKTDDMHLEWEPCGVCRLNESGVNTQIGTVSIFSSTQALVADMTSSIAAPVDATTPFTWGSGDEIVSNIRYEMEG